MSFPPWNLDRKSMVLDCQISIIVLLLKKDGSNRMLYSKNVFSCAFRWRISLLATWFRVLYDLQKFKMQHQSPSLNFLNYVLLLSFLLSYVSSSFYTLASLSLCLWFKLFSLIIILVFFVFLLLCNLNSYFNDCFIPFSYCLFSLFTLLLKSHL